jgi:hypothetical protein
MLTFKLSLISSMSLMEWEDGDNQCRHQNDWCCATTTNRVPAPGFPAEAAEEANSGGDTHRFRHSMLLAY